MIDASVPFVLLDDARRSDASPARLYRAPRATIVAASASELDRALDALGAARQAGLHAAGFLSYEAGFALEPKLSGRLAAGERPTPLCWFGLFEGYQEIPADEVPAWLPDPAGVWLGSVDPSISRAGYGAAFDSVEDYIEAGDIYQANLTQRFSVSMGDLAAAEVFLRLRERNPAAHGALLMEPARTIVSASPERFLRVRGRDAEMWPIKGTRPRGESVEDDERLAAELVESVKDRAENLMIVDLVRNDLGRVAEFGSVVVDELFGHRRLPTVHHLVSRVSARLREDARGCDVLRAAFPCGSITGAPKIRAMEIIEEVEGVRRGMSMGAIGYCGFDGRMDWSVAIRTMDVVGGVARFNVGGGVVADSDPGEEYEESMWKARALLEALRG